ncbi:MAG: TIGR03936 family radical SAM-associated protein [Treponema sp.]|nr:TIGR03936 family radical SAM-associated protein [Treponema sp.]
MSLSVPRYVNPVDDIGAWLLGVEKPGRYVGGEHGRLGKKDATLQTLIAFPDLYEIGMSNQALRIIYNGLNRIPDVSCDRAFAPAPDFEKMLKEKGIPLYGLDTGISLKDLDLLLFTLGYELGFSGILSMLDVSGIALRSAERGGGDPVIIAGGPAVSNPLPYSNFVDAFWIGEAEAGFFELAGELLEIKRAYGDGGAEARAAMLERLREHPNVWMKGKGKAVRAIDSKFHLGSKTESTVAVYPVPSMKIVQQHGILEIMRGCPNGCRFCHAGYWYRPMRQKTRETLVREAAAFINLGGYQEISLSSLSSGDYSGIGKLVDDLNDNFSNRHVSFQLPSLRVSTFSLSLLEKISRTRKSGLTFAVETPLDFWQMALNKQVTEDYVVQILQEAKRNGWRGAKFYFMIGLPLPPIAKEEEGSCEVFVEEIEIVNFVFNVAKRTAMHFNVNVGIFVPKPHTPYQWARQLDSRTAFTKLDFIRSKLKPKGHKVSISDSLVSMIEGVFSRGDERVGDMAEEAFRMGSRLDAWQEYIAKDAWRELLDRDPGIAQEFLSEKSTDAPLSWKPVSSGVSMAYLHREFDKSGKGELTAPCEEGCGASGNCGVCGKDLCIVRNRDSEQCPGETLPKPEKPTGGEIAAAVSVQDPNVWRLLFSFTKEGSAVFHGHLSLIEIFSMAMTRANLDVLYTQGFNPLVKLEIVSPLSIGISAGAEMAAADFPHKTSPGEFITKMNATLPDGIRINQAESYHILHGSKKRSLSSLLWGFAYDSGNDETAYVPVAEEKAFREKFRDTIFSLRRASVLAKNIAADKGSNPLDNPWASYFDVYRCFYR